MDCIKNENGAVLVVAMIILGLLAVIGTSITMNSSIELTISRNDKVHKTAFYRAENGRVIAAQAIRSADNGTTWSDGGSFDGNSNITFSDGSFFTEGFDVDNSVDNVTDSPDLQLTGSLQADVDIDKTEVAPLPGGAGGFGLGYEGLGHEGMVQAIYKLDSVGEEPSGATANVVLEYRLLPY